MNGRGRLTQPPSSSYGTQTGARKRRRKTGTWMAGAGLHRPQAHRHATGPNSVANGVHEQRQRVEAEQVEATAVDLEAREQGDAVTTEIGEQRPGERRRASSRR